MKYLPMKRPTTALMTLGTTITGTKLTEQIVDQRIRTFLFILSGAICTGTIIELWLAEHLKSPVQWIPIVLCGLGVLANVVVLLRTRRETLLVLRFIMTIVTLGSLLGIYQHLSGNFEFELEVHPQALLSDLFFKALRGVNPLLAPSVLAVAAMIAIAATYYHPIFQRQPDRLPPL